MFNFVIGVVVGAAFAPFWLKMWAMIQTTAAYAKVVGFFTKPK